VAHSLSAKKRIRQDVKRRGRNRWRKNKIKDAVTSFEEALHTGDKDKAAAQLKVASVTLAKVAAKGVIHKKTASRKQSRMTKALNKLAAKK